MQWWRFFYNLFWIGKANNCWIDWLAHTTALTDMGDLYNDCPFDNDNEVQS